MAVQSGVILREGAGTKAGPVKEMNPKRMSRATFNSYQESLAQAAAAAAKAEGATVNIPMLQTDVVPPSRYVHSKPWHSQ